MAPAVAGSLFTAAARLFALAPWRHVAEDQVIRADIPALDIDGAALCIIGGNGHDFGLLLFRSLKDYAEFSTLERAEEDLVKRGVVEMIGSLDDDVQLRQASDEGPEILRAS